MNAVLRRLFVSASLIALASAAVSRAADAAPAAAPAATPPPPAEPIVIANLTQNVPGIFSYGTWQNSFAVAQNAGFRLQGSKGAQGNGGLGHNIEPALDLTKAEFIEVALAVQPGNEVPEFTVALNDADGTQYGARVRVGQIMPGQPVWFRLKLSDFSPIGGQEGKNRKMEWDKIGQWHLQGDWTTKKPANVLLIALRAR